MIARQLSDRFRELTDNMDRMKTSAEEVDSANQGGTKAIHGLREKVSSPTRPTIKLVWLLMNLTIRPKILAPSSIRSVPFPNRQIYSP